MSARQPWEKLLTLNRNLDFPSSWVLGLEAPWAAFWSMFLGPDCSIAAACGFCSQMPDCRSWLWHCQLTATPSWVLCLLESWVSCLGSEKEKRIPFLKLQQVGTCQNEAMVSIHGSRKVARATSGQESLSKRNPVLCHRQPCSLSQKWGQFLSHFISTRISVVALKGICFV